MRYYITPLIGLIAAGSVQAAIVFTTDNAALNAGEGNFVSGVGTSFGFTSTGQNDSLDTNGVITGTISTTAAGGTWRPVADNEATSSAPAGTGNFQAIDFRPAGNVLANNETITFTISFNQTLSNGDSTPTIASLAASFLTFGFTDPPEGLEIGIAPTGSADLTGFANESLGTGSSSFAATSATFTSDTTATNNFSAAIRDPSNTPSDGTLTGWTLSITNNSGADWDNAGATPPLFRITFDGAIAVPEPSSTMLLSLAALGLCSHRRRK